MKKVYTPILGIVALVVLIIIYVNFHGGSKGTVCYINFNNTTIPTAFCYNDVKNIEVNLSNSFKQKILNSSIYNMVFFYPDYSGNYSAALLNLYLRLKYLKPNRTLSICLYKYKNCIFYTNMSISEICREKSIKVFYNTRMYSLYMIEFPINVSIPIILNLSYDIGVYNYSNCIVVSGDVETIRKTVSRFAYWIYKGK